MNNQSPRAQKYVKRSIIDWVASEEPLDTPAPNMWRDGIVCRSAGHKKHEYTSGYCIDSVFKFFSDTLSGNTACVVG